MRFITEDEFWEGNEDLRRKLKENGCGLIPFRNQETTLKYLKEGIFPSFFLHIDRRYKSNHPPLEKVYPFLKNCLGKDELKKISDDYNSLMRETLEKPKMRKYLEKSKNK